MPSNLLHNDIQESFEDFFEASLCGFVITNPKSIIERANTKTAEWAGCSTADLKGKHFTSLLSIGSKIYYETHLSPLLRMQGYFEEVVLEIIKSNGDKARVMVNAMERRTSEGGLLFIRFTIVKASDRLQYELNLQQAKNKAEDELVKQTNLTAVREQLIAVLGHDLRNPLAAISMVAELLEIPAEQEEIMALVATLKRSSLRMTELVNNIMDFAKTRLGDGIIVTKEIVLLKPVLEQVVQELKLVNARRHIVTDFNLDAPVNCDPHRIAQLLSNLVANAVTHGAVDTPVYITADYNDHFLTIAVVNNGIPISPAMQQNIFEPFTREANRPSQQGLGLGLFISKEIARAHGGNLVCLSTTEETRFTFIIPA